MPNSTYLREDGVIIVEYNGDQDYDTLKTLNEESTVIYNKLLRENRPVKAIIIQTNIGKLPPPSSWKIAVDSLRNHHYDKVAVVGGGLLARQIGKLIVLAIGRSHQFNFFEMQTDAEKWLKRYEKVKTKK